MQKTQVKLKRQEQKQDTSMVNYLKKVKETSKQKGGEVDVNVKGIKP